MFVVASLAVVGVAGWAGYRWFQRSQFMDAQVSDGCHYFTVQQHDDPARSCRVLQHRVFLIGAVDGSLTVLLDNSRGLSGVRIDYTGTEAGRFYGAIAVELAAADVPGLSAAERAQLAEDISKRGGIRAPWTVHLAWDG